MSEPASSNQKPAAGSAFASTNDWRGSSSVPTLSASGKSPTRKISSATTPHAATEKAAIWASASLRAPIPTASMTSAETASTRVA